MRVPFPNYSNLHQVDVINWPGQYLRTHAYTPLKSGRKAGVTSSPMLMRRGHCTVQWIIKTTQDDIQHFIFSLIMTDFRLMQLLSVQLKSQYEAKPLNITIFDNIVVKSTEAKSIKIDPTPGQRQLSRLRV